MSIPCQAVHCSHQCKQILPVQSRLVQLYFELEGFTLGVLQTVQISFQV